ncbi:exonuclease 1 [Euphorbia lathyris]|uniref:exonuclease 1 n=1 Tax=Euphorbia lathyris TaxID=212925 RepID=UPI003313AEE9
MGIKDLLRFMKPYIESIHIKKFAGKRVGIDAYSWLHKGAYSCSMEICLDSKGNKQLRYLDYFVHRINLLRFYKITPVVVFDGASIPCKAGTEDERNRRRETNRELAMEKLKLGNVNGAAELFQRAVSITPVMAKQLIKILKSEKVEFVVAPYEADAQLAYLSSLGEENGGISAVITEDSDLLAYGCQATIFKMDRFGNGDLILLDNVFEAVSCKPSFRYFDMKLFTGMCILAGCDFLPSVPGIGPVKAHSLVSKYRNLDRVLSVLKLEKGTQMPEDYPKYFKEAFAVFQHARIYDARTKKLKHMKPLSQDLKDSSAGELDYLGPDLPPSIAVAIAEGNLNPMNMEAFDCSPSSKLHQEIHAPLFISNFCEVRKPEAARASREKSCFLSNSSEITVAEKVIKQDQITEKKYIKEAVALQKLVSPTEPQLKTQTPMASDDIPPRKISNNPFMIKSCTEEVPIMLEDDELFCSTPESKVPCNNFSKKRKGNEADLHQMESIDEQISEVINVENVDISQESVNSKSRKGRGKNEKSKRSSLKTNDTKQNSILNFFSRV